MRDQLRTFVYAATFALLYLGMLQAGARAESSIVNPESKEIRIGWAVWFPYMFVDPKTQKVTGITVDIFELFASDLGKKAVFVEDSWATIIAGLQSGRYDVTMPLAPTPARSKAADFTSTVMKVMFGLAVLKENASKYSDWRDLNKPGVKVTTTLGASVHTAVQPKLNGGVDLILVKSSNESIAQLLTGRADAWANTMDAFIHVAKEHPSIVRVPGPPIDADGLALAVAQGNKQTVERVNAFMAKIKANGELLKILQKYGLDASFIAD